MQRLVVVGVVRRRDIRSQRPKTVERGGDELWAVDEVAEGLADVDVVERRLVHPHRERLDGARPGRERHNARRLLQDLHLRPAQLPGAVDDLADKGVLDCGGVLEVQDGNRVQVREPWLPIVLVADEDALLARREALVHERACAVGLVLLRPPVGCDVQEVPKRRQLLGEAPERARHGHFDGQFVELLQSLQVHGRKDERPPERGLRVEDRLERVDHVVRAKGFPVVEGDPRLAADDPVRGRTVRGDLLGQHVLELRLVAQLDQRLVKLLRASRPDGTDAPVERVERVTAPPAGEPDVQVAARSLGLRPEAGRPGQGRSPRTGGARRPGVEQAAGGHSSAAG